MKRVALYVRVSTEEQKNHGFSVDNQIDALKKYADDHGYIIVDIYNDAGISARKKYTKRPELLRLLGDCRNGKIDLILFTKIDRWFRNVSAYYQVQEILDECKVPWQTIWEDYETVTSSGNFKVNIMLSIAQAEADRTSERVKSVMEYKRDRGEVTGTVPLGYISKNSKCVIDESTKDIVNAFFTAYLNSFVVSEAMNAANAMGYTMTRRHAMLILNNPTYAGNGRYMKCEPYITEKQFSMIKDSIDGRRHKDPVIKGRRQFLFSGLLKCGLCGRNLVSEGRDRQTRKGPVTDWYYRCPCRKNSTHVEGMLEGFLLNNLDELLEQYKIDSMKYVKDNKNYDGEIKLLENKLKRIGDRYEDGDISREEYRSKRDIIKAQIFEIKSKIEPTGIEIELPSNWQEMYLSLDRLHKKAFWNQIISKMIVIKGQDPIILWK